MDPMIGNCAAGLMKSFLARASVGAVLSKRLRQRIGLWLLGNSMPVFVRGGDSISLDPLTLGNWESELTSIFHYFAVNGYDGFLIDIGANIGLTSAQCGDFFREVFMFEPNPEIFPILQLNTRLMLKTCQCKAFNFGLGPEYSQSILNVPIENWGGAFVRDGHNAYSDKLFEAKHAEAAFRADRYRKLSIEIRQAREVISPIFDDLRSKGFTRGVIKLDTEGYERAILEAVAPAIPADFGVMIAFENWDPDFDIDGLREKFKRPVEVFCLRRQPASKGSVWRDLPSMALRGGICHRLEPLQRGSREGEIFLALDPAT